MSEADEMVNPEPENESDGIGTLRRRNIIRTAQEKLEKGIYHIVFCIYVLALFQFVASELLKQKIPYSGHFLAPKRLWLKRISTPNCDVVICFPPGVKDSVLLWLLSKLKQSPGLTVHVRHHASTQSSAFYITAPFSV